MQDLGVNGRIVGGSIKFKGEEMNTMSPPGYATFAAARSL